MPTEPPTRPVSAEELSTILAGHDAFSGLSRGAIDALARAAEREFVPAGTILLASGGPPDSAFVVAHGRLRAIDDRASRRAGRPISLELGRGDVCALGMLVAQIPVAGHVTALRDSTVLRLRRESLLRCMAAHPELVVAQGRQLYENALRTHVTTTARPRIVTLLPAGPNVAIDHVVPPFLSALSGVLGPASRLDARRARELVGSATGDGLPERARHRLAEWCSVQEEQGRFVLLVCDPEDDAWTRWCLEQTDRIVVVAQAVDTGALERVRDAFAHRMDGRSEVAVDLLLVHASDVVVPRGMRPWLELELRPRLHHVRLDRAVDFQRAARRIGGRAVGLVLGGGGARALAHIGVIQALEEAGIPVDAVGGTSMGSVIAAGYARGWSPREMLALFAERVPDARALRDLDFPTVSLLAGHKLDDVLRFAFEELDVADLWLPCFCVSADLVDARMVVHDRGSLWQSVRASCSLPGIFPPVHLEGRLLIDGGAMNNVPIDVMERQLGGGTIIAVDVGAMGIGATTGPLGPSRSGWARLGDRLAGHSADQDDVSIMHILTSSTTLGSKRQMQQMVDEGHADLFLAPPVQHIKLLGFDARESLYEIAYEHTRVRLAEWSGLARVSTRPAEAARRDRRPAAMRRPGELR